MAAKRKISQPAGRRSKCSGESENKKALIFDKKTGTEKKCLELINQLAFSQLAKEFIACLETHQKLRNSSVEKAQARNKAIQRNYWLSKLMEPQK